MEGALFRHPNLGARTRMDNFGIVISFVITLGSLFSQLIEYELFGGKGIRTPGLLIANETLYQLSYTPGTFWRARV